MPATRQALFATPTDGAIALQGALIGDGRFRRCASGERCADSPPPCEEGLGVGGTPTFDALQSAPPCPSPTFRVRASGATGEGTLGLARCSIVGAQRNPR